jgi:catechol 2,3-dioxygenase-like lactoylglutathione lyase family enzyme
MATDASTDSAATHGAGQVVTVTGLDHIVLVTADVDRSLDFYCGLLGLEGDRVDEWRRGEVPFPSVRIDDATIIDLFPPSMVDGDVEATADTPAVRNLDHFCVTIEPTDLDALASSGRVEVVRGPQEHLFGAQGYASSLYIADPDGNTVELRSY